jgi:hypothetical protein
MNWIKIFKSLKEQNPQEYYRLLSELKIKEKECPNSFPEVTPSQECRQGVI